MELVDSLSGMDETHQRNLASLCPPGGQRHCPPTKLCLDESLKSSRRPPWKTKGQNLVEGLERLREDPLANSRPPPEGINVRAMDPDPAAPSGVGEKPTFFWGGGRPHPQGPPWCLLKMS